VDLPDCSCLTYRSDGAAATTVPNRLTDTAREVLRRSEICRSLVTNSLEQCGAGLDARVKAELIFPLSKVVFPAMPNSHDYSELRTKLQQFAAELARDGTFKCQSTKLTLFHPSASTGMHICLAQAMLECILKYNSNVRALIPALEETIQALDTDATYNNSYVAAALFTGIAHSKLGGA